MSHLKYGNYPGTEANSEASHYSQAVRIGNVLKTSGQGGWTEDGAIAQDPATQVANAVANVQKALQSLDPKASWENVFAVRSYHTNLAETVDHLTDAFKKHMPNHRPLFTCVEITKLGLEGMIIEIEVEAISTS